MNDAKVIVVGGGPAGCFAAVECAGAGAAVGGVEVLEQGPEFLAKVRVSGGGRCNLTHACFDPGELARHYPRGERELIGPFRRFQPRDTIAWFEARGVKLKTEPDGRIFPASNSSKTIVECLLGAARAADVRQRSGCGVERAARRDGGGFELTLSGGESARCERLLLATGGCRTEAGGALAVALGHTLEPPVPSLFTFRVETPWLRQLAGVSVPSAEISVPDTELRERGPLLATHSGVSGPAVLRLSARGARLLHDRDYRFALCVNWLPERNAEALAAELQARRRTEGARRVVASPFAPLPARLWGRLACAAGLRSDTRWADLSREGELSLIRQLTRTELPVSGRDAGRGEFVTCGGVRLSEVDFRTMESRICPGLYFAGALLDLDGLPGGFNFQAAWTTGWLAGRAMAG